jgi:lipopolysaccharide export system permease protein
MRAQDLAGSANVPYRRETFAHKKIVLDFDGEFNLTDMAGISADARGKGMEQIFHDLDSMQIFNDSIGHAFLAEAKMRSFYLPQLQKKDSLRAMKEAASTKTDFDSIVARLSKDERRSAVRNAMEYAQMEVNDLEFKGEYAKGMNRRVRTHQIEAYNKITLALSCIIFFFIGAPLGAIIRKGGLGVPVIISVLVFIVYYIFENSGMKMARDDNWTVWFGKWISTFVLAPLAVFFTYKANNDSVVFNIDLYKDIVRRMLGLRGKRSVNLKEVIIEAPIYALDSYYLLRINEDIRQYSVRHKLLHLPNPIEVFFRPGNDQEIERIVKELEDTIEDLGNSKDKQLIVYLNDYPLVATHAHTRPFRRKWLNVITGLILPVGLFFYLRMCRFRIRLRKDLSRITETTQLVVKRINDIAAPAPLTLEDVEQMPFVFELAREAEAKQREKDNNL